MDIKTKDDFAEFVAMVESRPGYKKPSAFGLAVCILDSVGETLDAWFPEPNFNDHLGSAAVLHEAIAHSSISTTNAHTFGSSNMKRAEAFFNPFKGEEGHPNMDCIFSLWEMWEKREKNHPNTSVLKVVFIYDLNEPPQTVEDAYLRLHLLSSQKVESDEINLDGIFAILPNNAWTSEGPISLADLPKRQMEARSRLHPLHVHYVDKLPRIVNYIVPPDTYIKNISSIPLGGVYNKGGWRSLWLISRS